MYNSRRGFRLSGILLMEEKMKYTILKWHNILKHTPESDRLLLIKNLITLNYDFAVFDRRENKFYILNAGTTEMPKIINKTAIFEWTYIPEVKINA